MVTFSHWIETFLECSIDLGVRETEDNLSGVDFVEPLRVEEILPEFRLSNP